MYSSLDIMGAPVDSPAAQVRPLQCPSHGTAASPAAGQRNPLPLQEGRIFERPNAPSSPSAGRFQFPAPDSHQLTGFARIAFSHQLQALRAYLVNSLRSAPSYRTVVRLRKQRPAGGRAGHDTSTQNVAPMGHVNPTRMAGDDHHSLRLIAIS